MARTNKMVRPTVAEPFTVYPLERGGHGLFSRESGYQVATFPSETQARKAAYALNGATFVNALAPL